jgi:asparagine synthase (glutamine-hydrolysing)
MCGIAGSLSLDGSPIREAAIRAMTDALVHRGPDEGAVRMLGQGSGHGARVLGMGQRRLKVIDLSAAASQPMTDSQNRGWIVYNGELYNAAELRGELQARGATFRSRCDTEVVLQALLAWGDAALDRLNGMFALAFWEIASKRLLLARDRYGEKPLYYVQTGGRLIFASELGALPWHGGIPLEIDPEAVELYLTFGFIPAPWTIYRAVRKLPHASLLVAAPGRAPTVRRYYRLEDRLDRDPGDPRAEAVRAALERAVRRRVLADVPLGAFLSGGVDSSAVVTLMRPAAPSPLRTYSMAVPDLGYFDESGRARATSRRLGTEHHEVRVDAARLQAEIPTVRPRSRPRSSPARPAAISRSLSPATGATKSSAATGCTGPWRRAVSWPASPAARARRSPPSSRLCRRATAAGSPGSCVAPGSYSTA